MSLYRSEYKTVVSFEDLDPMNIVWHGNYVRYIEQARCKMFSELHYTYVDMKKDGYAYPVAKMSVKYIKPAEFEDVLKCITEIVSIEPALDIKYTIYNDKTGDKIFEATTMQIAVNINTRQSVYVPPVSLVKALEKASDENI